MNTLLKKTISEFKGVHGEGLCRFQKSILSFFVFIFTTGFVRPATMMVTEMPPAEKWPTLSQSALPKKIKTVKDPLARAAIYKNLSQWEACAAQAARVPSKSIIKDWAVFYQLSCAQSAADNDTKSAGIILPSAIKRAEAQLAVVNRSPNKDLEDHLQQQVLAASLSLCRYYDKHGRWKDLQRETEHALKFENYFSKPDRALLFYFAGNALVAERQWVNAFWNYRRARDLDPTSVLTDARMKAIVPMLPSSLRGQIEEAQDSTVTVPEEGPSSAVTPSNDELDLFNQAQNYLTRSDTVSAADALEKLLRKFPGGVKAKWAQDKLTELMGVEVDKSRGPLGVSIAKRKILNIMLDFDLDRLQEWGHALFDMQDYADAAELYKKAADQLATSSRASKALYMAARSYQLAGETSDAKSLFKRVIRDFPAAAEVTDAAIQWGLTDLNDNDPSEAISHFELARSRRMGHQQDLISLFWLYESYKQKNTTVEMKKAQADLINRFGLTYYGLIAYNDFKNELPQFEAPKVKTGKTYFSDSENRAFERARALLQRGLFDEAASELNPIVSRPLNDAEAQVLANFFAQAMKYTKTFSLLMSVVDESPEKRNDFVVREIFPKEYWNLVSDEKLRAEIDPLLLLSVMKQESAFDQRAVSRSGALGLLQMIPPTAMEVSQDLQAKLTDPKTDLFDPTVNVRFCAWYLAKLIKKYDGSIPLALAAYNAGPKRISLFMNSKNTPLKDTWVDELPWAETSYYVKSILKNYLMYRVLYTGLTQLPVPPWALPQPPAPHSAIAPAVSSGQTSTSTKSPKTSVRNSKAPQH